MGGGSVGGTQLLKGPSTASRVLLHWLLLLCSCCCRWGSLGEHLLGPTAATSGSYTATALQG